MGRARELAQEVEELRSQLDRLGAWSVLELEHRREQLRREIAEHTAALDQERRDAAAQLELERHEKEERIRGDLALATEEVERLTARLHELRGQVALTEEVAILQEIGVYEYIASRMRVTTPDPDAPGGPW